MLRFVSILFLLFEKGISKKNCARYFEVRKYTFLIFKKRLNKKFARNFKICKYTFLILEKKNKQKIVLRFVSILF